MLGVVAVSTVTTELVSTSSRNNAKLMGVEVAVLVTMATVHLADPEEMMEPGLPTNGLSLLEIGTNLSRFNNPHRVSSNSNTTSKIEAATLLPEVEEVAMMVLLSATDATRLATSPGNALLLEEVAEVEVMPVAVAAQ
jgi:hypothetical protein